jgi:F-box-like/Transglutaminase-like superfamily
MSFPWTDIFGLPWDAPLRPRKLDVVPKILLPDEATLHPRQNDATTILPNEAFEVLASFLPDATTVYRCSVVCKAFYNATLHRRQNDAAPKLPDEVFAVIASYLPDATTVCRCSEVSKAFYKAIRSNDLLWKNLADTVWKIAPVPNEPATCETLHSFYQAEFRRRHELDMIVVNIVCPIAAFLMDRTTLRRQLTNYFQWGAHRPNSQRLVQLFPVSVSTEVTSVEAANDPLQALDGMRRYALIHQSRMNPGDRRSATIHCVARCIMNTLFFGHVFRQWTQLLLQFESLPSKRYDDDADSDAAMSLFLEGLRLLSQLYLDDQEFLAPSQFGLLMSRDAIAKQLKVYGSLLQQELGKQRGGEFSAVEAMETLCTLLYRDWGFVGRGVSTDLLNFSIYSVLATRKGDRLCLCIIVKLILHQVGVDAHVLVLPRVVGVAKASTGMAYFKIHNRRARRVTLEQIQEHDLTPTPPKMLWGWILFSIAQTAEQSFQDDDRSAHLTVQCARAIRMIFPIETGLEDEIERDMFDNEMRRGKLEPLTLFPDFFRECGLI